jgi:hypothetical protein
MALPDDRRAVDFALLITLHPKGGIRLRPRRR